MGKRERKRNIYLFANDLADIGGSGIGNRDNLYQLSILDLLRFPSSEDGLEVDTPICTEPGQALQSDDGTAPDKSPFRRTNVFLV